MVGRRGNPFWIYEELASREGMLVVHRAEAHCLRLQMLYALLDGSNVIEKVHVKAAFAIWQYCEACALSFLSRRSEPRCAKDSRSSLRKRIRRSNEDGHQRPGLQRNRTHKQLVGALVELERQGFAFTGRSGGQRI